MMFRLLSTQKARTLIAVSAVLLAAGAALLHLRAQSGAGTTADESSHVTPARFASKLDARAVVPGSGVSVQYPMNGFRGHGLVQVAAPEPQRNGIFSDFRSGILLQTPLQNELPPPEYLSAHVLLYRPPQASSEELYREWAEAVVLFEGQEASWRTIGGREYRVIANPNGNLLIGITRAGDYVIDLTFNDPAALLDREESWLWFEAMAATVLVGPTPAQNAPSAPGERAATGTVRLTTRIERVSSDGVELRLVEWMSYGDSAVQATIEAGQCTLALAEEGGCLPGGFFIRTTDTKLSLPVASDAEISLFARPSETDGFATDANGNIHQIAVSYEAFQQQFAKYGSLPLVPYTVTTRNGNVIRIEEIYVP